MPYKERLTILHDAEVNDLYSIPTLSLEEKRISFALNDLEQDVIKSIRDRNHKCYAIALLGYFKIKPILLNPSYKALKEDLTFIAEEYFPKFKVPRFSVSRAMYLLDYIDDASLRNYVQRALNRGEAYHQLRRAIAHVNGNRFRGKNDDEINLWNECARLLTNAIIYFNSLILTRLLEHFESKKDDKKLEIIKQVSPVAWHNINLNGTYSFSFEQNLLDLDEIMQSIVQNEN